MHPESSDGFASVGTILPKEKAALLPGGFLAFQTSFPSPPGPLKPGLYMTFFLVGVDAAINQIVRAADTADTDVFAARLNLSFPKEPSSARSCGWAIVHRDGNDSLRYGTHQAEPRRSQGGSLISRRPAMIAPSVGRCPAVEARPFQRA